MHFVKFHLGDYSKNTGHLSLLEHGVYFQLLRVYYATEKPIQDSQKYRCVGARSSDERGAVDAVLNDFFELTGGEWRLERCDEEIQKYQKRQETNRKNASKKERSSEF